MKSTSRYILLLAAVLTAPLCGAEDKCANLDSTKPIICLSVGNDKLTITRRSGEMAIYASFFASAAIVKPVKITITVGSPNNPSGVKLDEGRATIVKTAEIDAAHPLKEVRLIDVRTSSDNPTSGRLYFPIFLRSEDGVEVQGSPTYVTMDTNP